MTLLGKVRSRYKKSEAAVVVQKLLEQQVYSGTFDLDPVTAANKLIEAVWRTKPDIFDGKFGQRPHKIAVAASALANGIDLFNKRNLNRNALILSLGNILTEIETNGRLYPLNSLDNQLLEASSLIFTDIFKKISVSPLAQEINKFVKSPEFATWEDWFKIFKVTAGEKNPQLQIGDDGLSLIDLMDVGPLRKAFNDGVNPKFLATNFSSQFDIRSFGIGPSLDKGLELEPKAKERTEEQIIEYGTPKKLLCLKCMNNFVSTRGYCITCRTANFITDNV